MAIQPSHVEASRQSYATQILNGVSTVGFSAGSGALIGYMFSIIHPVGGAIFGGTTNLVSIILDPLIRRTPFNTAIKVGLYFALLIVSIAAGAAATTAFGFPLTVLRGVVLTIAMAPSGIGLKLAIGTTKCAGACIAGGALALKERIC